MVALRWRQIDLDRGTLTIERSVAQTRAGLLEKTTKSSQDRGVALDPQTVEFLRAHWALIEARCTELGIAPSVAGFVFSLDPDGGRSLLPRSVTQRYRRMAIKLGLRSTRLHGLRHYTATELLAAGVDLRTVAGRLGPGDGVTTLRTYAGRVTEADRRAAVAMATSCPCRTRPSAVRSARMNASPPNSATRSPPDNLLPAPNYPPSSNSPPTTMSLPAPPTVP